MLSGLADPAGEEIAPAQHTMITLPPSTPSSPLGWITGDGSSLEGNNATSHLHHHTLPGLTQPSAIYDYAFNTVQAALVNAWHLANDAHDRFYVAGFDDASDRGAFVSVRHTCR